MGLPRVGDLFAFLCLVSLVSLLFSVLFPRLGGCAPRVQGSGVGFSCFGGFAGGICLHWPTTNINIAMIYTYFHPVSLSFGTYTTVATLAESHGLNAASLRTSFSRCCGDLLTLRCGAVVFRSPVTKCKALRRGGFNR